MAQDLQCFGSRDRAAARCVLFPRRELGAKLGLEPTEREGSPTRSLPSPDLLEAAVPPPAVESPAELQALQASLRGDPEDLRRIRFGEHDEPHRVLGPHAIDLGTTRGWGVRAHHPEAKRAWMRFDREQRLSMRPIASGVFAAFVTGGASPPVYQLEFERTDGSLERTLDPYRFEPTIGDDDLKWFELGKHPRLWEILGAHWCCLGGTPGTAFATWAPNARRVSVVGDFCQWDGRRLPMRALGSSGIWELFVPGLGVGTDYEFEVRTAEFALLRKSDPFAFESSGRNAGRASRVARSDYVWTDADWLRARAARCPEREPMAVYEVHAGSWARPESPDVPHLTYRELAHRLVEHARRFGFTHIELLPLSEHAFYGSWGYLVTSHFAPTARYGTPDELRAFVDFCHRNGIGVILDWVPAHFPGDAGGLVRFDGTSLFEVTGSEPATLTSWGTHRFDLSCPQVRNYLIANAVYWASEFHLDGLRVDAVAAMLGYAYGSEDAIAPSNPAAEVFLRQLNAALHEAAPGVVTIAEDSSPTRGMTRAVSEGGFGFTFKWNLGWMHDTLAHFERQPDERGAHQNELLFSMAYEHDERFVNALSHDEVVHGKRSLLARMPGPLEKQLANLRLLLAYQYTRPGKKLLFMGMELGAATEWDHDRGLDWSLEDDLSRRQFQAYLSELGRVYLDSPALWHSDPDPEGFAWLESGPGGGSVLTYQRRDGQDRLVVVLNLSATLVKDFWVQVPGVRPYRVLLSTADPAFGGRGGTPGPELHVEARPGAVSSGRLRFDLPPLTGLLLLPT